MSRDRIYLSPPFLAGKEIDYMLNAVHSNWIAPIGPAIDTFEKTLGEVIGAEGRVLCLSSGTAAIHLALKLIGVNNGDFVICQSFTFVASANPILYQGAIPIFVDSEEGGVNMDPKLLEEAILFALQKGKKPKAIICTNLYGIPCNFEPIKKLAKSYAIPIIEDAAESLGSIHDLGKCGSLGDYGILSFNGNKIITTSGGGALVCPSEKLKEKAKFYATQAKDDAPHYQHSEIGYNYRLPNVLAAIGQGQIEMLNSFVSKKRQIFQSYKLALGNYFDFFEDPKYANSNKWLTCVLTKSFDQRERIRLSLESDNIESRPLWKPLHLQPLFKGSISFTNGVAENYFERGLCLPSGSSLQSSDQERIIKIILKTL